MGFRADWISLVNKYDDISKKLINNLIEELIKKLA